MFWTYFLIVCSFIMLAWTAGTIFWRYKFNSKLRLKKTFIAIVQLFSAVFFLVGAGVCVMNLSPEKLDGPDSFVKVLSYTFQLFTLDETFESALSWMTLIKEPFFRGLYMGLSLIYSVLVPLAGGFIIFNLLGSIAPKFRLAINSVKRAKYVFSELNERSVTLAEDIAEQSWNARRISASESEEHTKWLKSCVIVFMNVKRDDADSELLDRAGRIGAICLEGDILERSFYFFTPYPKKIVYFMMDTDPWENLDSAVTLLSTKRELWKRTITERSHDVSDDAQKKGTRSKRQRKVRLRKTDNMNMYVFTENPEASPLLEEAFGYNCEMRKIAYHDDKKDRWESGVAIADCDGDITVFVVNEYKNLVYQMLRENDGAALLAPLKVRSQKGEEHEDTTATSDGNKSADGESEASEAPVSSTGDKHLKIAVFGSGKIAKEFFKTAVWCAQILDPDVKEPIKDGTEYKTVSVDIHMISENAEDFGQNLRFLSPGLFDSEGNCVYLHSATFEDAGFGTQRFRDLFDAHGLDRADVFLIALGDDGLNMQAASWTRTRLLRSHAGGDVEIYFAIENDALCKTLKRRSLREKGETVKLHPFGSLKERFSFDNIVRPDIERIARDIDSIHDGRRTMKTFIGNYNFESSIASALHSPYRMYGVKGMDLKSEDTVNRLYWLEHLRWSAYTASIGLTLPSVRSFLDNKDSKGKVSTKNTLEGWHSCLVPSGATYISPVSLLKDVLNAFDIPVPDDEKDKVGLSAALRELNKLIIPADDRVAGDEPLDKYIREWYRENILDKKKDRLKFKITDPLDLLNLYMSIYNMTAVDLKSYDVFIAQNTFASIRQQTISDELKKPRPNMDVIRREIQAISDFQNKKDEEGKPASKAKKAEEEGKGKVNDDPSSVAMSYIASTGDEDLILLRGSYLSSLHMTGKCEVALDDEGGVEDMEMSPCVKKHVIPIDGETLLVRLPFEKPVCIGYRRVKAEGAKGGSGKRKAYLYQEARHSYVLEQQCGDNERATPFDNQAYIYIGESEGKFKIETSYNLSVKKPYEGKLSIEEVAQNVEMQKRADEERNSAAAREAEEFTKEKRKKERK